VQSGKTASGGCSAGPRFVRAVAPRIIIDIFNIKMMLVHQLDLLTYFKRVFNVSPTLHFRKVFNIYLL
jgi:hypothetical protein